PSSARARARPFQSCRIFSWPVTNSSLPAPRATRPVRPVCDDTISGARSTRWRVTNISPSGHLPCIEARAPRAHSGSVPQLLAAAIVMIRIYNYAAAPPAEIDTARAVADGIFHETGISLQWMDCPVAPLAPV